jgi:hypothetical protein
MVYELWHREVISLSARLSAWRFRRNVVFGKRG